MATIYRVSVIEVGDERDETLFEVAGPAHRVTAALPMLADVLTDAAQERPVSLPSEPPAVAYGSGGGSAPIDMAPAATTKRKRRTKAEIAADEAAQAVGFRDAAHQAEAAAVANGAYPAPDAVPNGNEQPPAAPAPAAPDGQPVYNPFATG